jgi:hypothetical protein
MDNKCKCGHVQESHGVGICYQRKCLCGGFQPCIEPEPQPQTIPMMCPEKGCLSRSKAYHCTVPHDKAEGCDKCHDASGRHISHGCVPYVPEPASPVKDRIELKKALANIPLIGKEPIILEICDEEANAQLPAIIASAKREQAREIRDELDIRKDYTTSDISGFHIGWAIVKSVLAKYIPEEK